ncbi:hypothetical protein GGU11DRAFT_833730 [Lentinula aff. detonsa]|nr:hypothetical protein GGU11DRAFT_833730 [Lentinula aff. detonsa]
MPNTLRFPSKMMLAGEDNWWQYKREVTLAIESKGLAGYLDGSIPRPKGTTMPATAPTTLYSRTPAPEEWYAHDRFAVNTITSNMVDPTGLGVDYAKPAAQIWSDLISQFELLRARMKNSGFRRTMFSLSFSPV